MRRAALWALPKQPPYPRVSAQRLDGVPGNILLFRSTIGVFQELREAVLSGTALPGAWLVHCPPEPGHVPARPRPTLQAFGKMDFIVTMDIIMNDTSWFSDVVLPEASYLERYDPLNIVGDKAFIRQPVIEAQGEGKSALWIYKELGTRLGLADYFQYKDEEDYLNQQLAPLGVSLADVRQKGYVDLPETGTELDVELTWNTPCGKIEIFSDTLDKGGFPGVPQWEEPPAPKPGEFYLLTGKVAQYTQFGTQNNQLLHKYADEPRLWMNAQTAKSLGLADGDMVEVTSDGRQDPYQAAGHPGHPPGLRLPDARVWAPLQGSDHRLWCRRQRLGPARHLYRPGQRRPGAQPDICNGKEDLMGAGHDQKLNIKPSCSMPPAASTAAPAWWPAVWKTRST